MYLFQPVMSLCRCGRWRPAREVGDSDDAGRSVRGCARDGPATRTSPRCGSHRVGGARQDRGQVNGRPRERRWTPTWPVDLTTTLGVLQHGPRDPTMRAAAGQVWRTTRTPEGPATVHYRRSGPDVVVRAWGPGAQTELDAVPDVLGRGDDPEGFAHDAHPAMAAAHRRFGSGWRVIRTRRVLESLVPAILEQRVTGREASAAWARLVREFGDPAPGPTAPDVPGSADATPLTRPPLAQPPLASQPLIPTGATPRSSLPPTGPPGRGYRVGRGIGPEWIPVTRARSPRPRNEPRPSRPCPPNHLGMPATPCAPCPGSGCGRPPRSVSARGAIGTRCRSATSTSPAWWCTR